MKAIIDLLRYAAVAILAVFFILLAVFVLGPMQWFQDRRDRRAAQEYLKEVRRQ